MPATHVEIKTAEEEEANSVPCASSRPREIDDFVVGAPAGTARMAASKKATKGDGLDVTVPANIPKDSVWEYRECYDWFLGKSQRGFVTASQLPDMLRSMGQFWSYADLRELASEHPASSRVDFQTFLNVCSKKVGFKPDRRDLVKAFQVVDTSNKGEVQLEELKHILTTIGEKLTDSEFDELCRRSGFLYKGGNQAVSLDQFLQMFSTE